MPDPNAAETHARLVLDEASQHRILEQAVQWALARDAQIDVLTQDEFTHDVIMELPTGPILVYDTT